MIFIPVFAICGAVALTLFWYDVWESIIGKIIGSAFAVIVGGLIGMYLSLVPIRTIELIAKSVDVEIQSTVSEEIDIYSVVDNFGQEGSFFLGIGNISNKLKYYYIVKESLGERVECVDAKNTYIVYVDGQPKIKKYDRTFKGWEWFTLGDYVYVLEVPEDTIKYDYNIDLQ